MRERPPPPSVRCQLSSLKRAAPSSVSTAAQMESCNDNKYARIAEMSERGIENDWLTRIGKSKDGDQHNAKRRREPEGFLCYH